MAGRNSREVELAGRSWVVSRLLAHGIEVATPVVDSGIDLIAFKEAGVGGIKALPLQLKCATGEAFSLNAKYAERGITMIYVWRVMIAPTAFIMSYAEALAVLGEKSASTASFAEQGAYSMSSVSNRSVSTSLNTRIGGIG
ncbi:hypothetical protein [Brevundimonas sp.]|uniref:hypothetical protein n=1 Tax=Brevundimonas sp. TaxID=1871086 RepID=UPI0035647F90